MRSLQRPRVIALLSIAVSIVVAFAGCRGTDDDFVRADARAFDAAIADAPSIDGPSFDGRRPDGARPDTARFPDLDLPDTAPGDLGSSDAAPSDSGTADAAVADVTTTSGQVVINEVHYAPDSALPDADPLRHEYVELYNRGSTAISLIGWVLADDGGPSTPLHTFGSVSLPAGAYMVVYSSSAAGNLAEDTDLSDGSGRLVAGTEWTASDLRNTGDAVQLLDGQGAIHDFIYYDQSNAGDPAVDDAAVTAGLWKDGAAIDTLSSGTTGRAIGLTVDGQSPNEIAPTADAEDTDWMQYASTTGGTPGGSN